MAGSKRLTAAQRRSQLLEIATEVFSEQGFVGASIDQIAKRSGVSRPIVYGHFGGKEELFSAVAEAEVGFISERVLKAAREAKGPEAQVRASVYAFFAYAEERPDGFRMLCRDTPIAKFGATTGTPIGEMASRLSQTIGDVDDDSPRQPAARIVVHSFFGMMSSAALFWRENPGATTAEVSELMSNLVWNGLQSLQLDEPGEPS